MFSVTYTVKTILTHQTVLMVIKTTNLYIFMLFYIGATIIILEVSKYPQPPPHTLVYVCVLMCIFALTFLLMCI